MISNNKLLMMYRYMFLAGAIIEPFWGYYLGIIMNLNDSIPLRLFCGAVSLVCGILTYNVKLFQKHISSIIIICSIIFIASRYYLLKLNPENWNYIIDLYTIFILWLIIVPSKKQMYYFTPLFILPSLLFPFNDYVAACLMITISPLVGSLKWVFFDLSDKYEIAKEKIQESNLLIGSQKTLSVLSHQINNFLETINLNNEILRNGQNLKSSDIIEQNILNISKLMHSYNLTSQAIDGFKFEKVNQVLVEIIEDFKDKKIKYKINSYEFELKMNKKLFKLAVNNIINNALFEVKNIKNGEVKIELTQSEDFLSVVIQDNAESLSKDNIIKVFKPFFSTKSINDGCGLGLSITKEIIDNIGGDIIVTVNPTTFIIRFPNKIIKNIA